MAVTTKEATDVATKMAELLSHMSNDQWKLFQGGMLQSDEPDFSQQQIMDGFAALIHGGYEVRWQWDVCSQEMTEAAQERQRLINMGQLEMFPHLERSN